MKKTKRMLAALMSAVMLGTCSAVPDVTYAETDTSVPFMVTIDNPKLTKGFFAVMLKKDYSKETIENTLIPELINTTGNSVLTFISLTNQTPQFGTVIWKKYEVFNPAVNLFLEQLKAIGKSEGE